LLLIFSENYIKSINAVTIEDKDVANKYFLADNIRVLVVGKGSEVARIGETKNNVFLF
jgi:predicted Zn-dependent peptidase